MVHFADEDHTDITLNLENRIEDATQIRKKISIMDKTEGLSKEFQTKVSFIFIYDMIWREIK